MPKTRVAVVSGGNRGLGREICRQLLTAGVSVALGSRDAAAGKKVAAELEAEVESAAARIVSFPLDVTSEDSIKRFGKAVLAEFGSVDILVNNAGILPESRNSLLEQTTPKMFRQIFDVNLFGAVIMCQTFVPVMKKYGYGRIVNVSTGLGQLERMGSGMPAYRMSKTALNALTRTLAAELAGTGILVNSVSPGWVKTDMGGRNAERSVEEGAETAVWLCLLQSSGPTGGFFRDRKEIPW